jgi:hypothetical protein
VAIIEATRYGPTEDGDATEAAPLVGHADGESPARGRRQVPVSRRDVRSRFA